MAGNMNTLMAVHIGVDDAANFDYTVTRGFQIVDVFASTNFTVGATTNVLTNKSGSGYFPVIGAPLATDTVDDVEYCTTVVAAQASLAAGDTIRAVGTAATMDADLFVQVIPTSWIAG